MFNPSLGVVAARVALAVEAEVDAAVRAARAAFPAWAATPALKRARVLFKFKEIVEQRRGELAKLIASEHGKLVSDAAGEVTRGLEVVEFACGAPHLLKGEFADNVGTGVDSYSLRQPLGVAVGITPFNFPAMVPLWMFPVALVCGNCFILKPSERDPGAAIVAGAVAGRSRVCRPACSTSSTATRSRSTRCCAIPAVNAVSFVGLDADRRIRAARRRGARQARAGAGRRQESPGDAAGRRRRPQVCDALLGAAYGSAGERCMAISVAVAVGDATADRLVDDAVDARERNLRIDHSQNGDADMGPLITAAHRAQSHRLHRRRRGRRRAPGGRRPRPQGDGLRERLLPRW